jgi:hypothetical protein
MAEFWSAIQASDLAVWINQSRWAYAVVTTMHVLAIGILFGSILTLDLCLVGVARWLEPEALARLVVPVAGMALGLGVLTGGLLFIGRAGEYAAFGTFRIKLLLIGAAIVMTLVAHRRYGLWLQRADARQRVRIGVGSMVLWFAVVVSGRMIAFVHD